MQGLLLSGGFVWCQDVLQGILNNTDELSLANKGGKTNAYIFFGTEYAELKTNLHDEKLVYNYRCICSCYQ